MAEEEKPKQLVQMSTVFASGITAIVAALFTSRLGVAGTLIGTALTPMLMTIGVAILNAQIEKATNKFSNLPNTVRGHLSTQRVRVPGTPTPEATPEEPEPPAGTRRRDRRTPGVLERLLSIPTYLKEMTPSIRRRTLLTGAAAGLVAAVIGLGGVTVLETALGSNFSCKLWDNCAEAAVAGEEAGGGEPSIIQALDSGDTETQESPVDSEGLPAEDQQQDAQPAPGAQPAPEDQQYQGTPQGGDGQDGEAPVQTPAEPSQQEQPAAQEDPGAIQQDGSQQPSADPDAEQQQQQPAIPSEQQQ